MLRRLWYNLSRRIFLFLNERRERRKRLEAQWLVESVNEKWRLTVPAFEAPFINANEYLNSLSEERLYQYLNAVDNFVKSDACDVEFDNISLYFEKELALRSQNDVERAAYRATLIFIRDFKKRLIGLSQRLDQIEKRGTSLPLKEQIKNI